MKLLALPYAHFDYSSFTTRLRAFPYIDFVCCSCLQLLFALKAHPCLTTLDLRGNRIDLETDIATALSSYSGVNMSFQSPPRK